MAVSCRTKFHVAAVLACCLYAAAHAAAVHDLIDAGKGVEITWDSSGGCEVSIGDKTLDCRKVRISQGELSIEAAKATATSLDFRNSKWSFQGDVHIKLPEGRFDSESATVVFSNNQVSNALLTGNPATFEQHLKEKSKTVHGRAGAIEYKVAQATVQFENQVYLSDGSNEMAGRTLTYDIRNEKVIADSSQQDGGRIKVTINPNTAGAEIRGTAPPSDAPSNERSP